VTHGLVGTSLEHYRLEAPLGAGAMSEVYLAHDMKLGKKVAVKVIHPNAALDPEQVTRFEREARAAARLNHPHVAIVYFAGATHFGAPFYAMELIRGWSMDELIDARMRFRLEHALGLFAQACSGLDAAYRAGIFHRDIKPANLMVGRDGILKIVDFGLAKLNDDASLTRSGTMMGTPTYMAPEIARGTGGDHRSDIYSLGVTFFHMLAGFAPFEAETTYGVLLKHIQDERPNLREVNPRLPERLAALVRRMMAKEPEARPWSHAQVHHELVEISSEVTVGPATNPQLAWCAVDERVTVAVGAKCSECGGGYAAYRRPDRFHVDIVGWNENDGRAAVALHIGKQIAQAAVARQLETLPYRAAQRVPRDRARQLQRTLYDLGADVELAAAEATGRTADKGRTPTLPRKAIWPPSPLIGAGEGAPRNTLSDGPTTQARLRAALDRVGRPSRVNIGLVAAIVVLTGLLVGERLRTDPAPDPIAAPIVAEAPPAATTTRAVVLDRREPPVDASPSELPEAEVAADTQIDPPSEPPSPVPRGEAAEPEVEAPTSTWFQVTLGRDVDPGAAAAGLAALDAAASELAAALGVRRHALAVELSSAPVDIEERGWTAAPYAPVLVLPTGGGSDEASMYRPSARGLVTRAAISAVSARKAPAWLVVGVSLFAEQGPTTVDENAAVIAADHLFPTRILAGTQENDAATERALRSFAAFLVDQYGWPQMRVFAERLGAGDTLDDAGRSAFSGSMAELELAWQDACGLE
jgi:tRNA A-37 threonylcarbamoyl transferase component Bud32